MPELIDAAREGDRAALEQLLRDQYDHIYALARRLLGDQRDAEDATQEALVAIVRGLSRFDGRSALGTWVYRITTNVCLDELRRRRRRPDTTQLQPGDHRATVAPSESVVDDRLEIDAALTSLAPEYRAAVVLRDLCDLDYSEIGEVLGIPPGTVRSRIARGRAALARSLAGNQPGPDERRTEVP